MLILPRAPLECGCMACVAGSWNLASQGTRAPPLLLPPCCTRCREAPSAPSPCCAQTQGGPTPPSRACTFVSLHLARLGFPYAKLRPHPAMPRPPGQSGPQGEATAKHPTCIVRGKQRRGGLRVAAGAGLGGPGGRGVGLPLLQVCLASRREASAIPTKVQAALCPGLADLVSPGQPWGLLFPWSPPYHRLLQREGLSQTGHSHRDAPLFAQTCNCAQ